MRSRSAKKASSCHDRLLLARSPHVRGIQRERLAHDGTPVRAPVARDRDRDDAERGAAEAVGILRAGGRDSQEEEAGERVESVREREDRARGLARRVVRGRGRAVLVVDGLPDRVGMALAARVDPAHDPLQIRELLDQLRRQVRLRQQARGAHRLDEVRAPDADRDRLGEVLDARRLRAIAAEPVLERQLLELRQARLEAVPHVVVEEEPRVGEPRVQHPLAALGDEALAVVGVVHDRDEVRQQARRAAHRQELLVRAHRRDRDLLGELQKLRRVRAPHEARPLDEVGERRWRIRVGLDRAADLGTRARERPRESAPAAPRESGSTNAARSFPK